MARCDVGAVREPPLRVPLSCPSTGYPRQWSATADIRLGYLVALGVTRMAPLRRLFQGLRVTEGYGWGHGAVDSNAELLSKCILPNTPLQNSHNHRADTLKAYSVRLLQ